MEDMCQESVLVSKQPQLEAISLDDFVLVSMIGKGSFGRVFLAQLSSTGVQYAMKAIRKDRILENKTLECTKLEMNILMQVNHPFLCGLDYVFQS